MRRRRAGSRWHRANPRRCSSASPKSLQLAARRTEASRSDDAGQAQVADAAVLFVGAALLQPGNGHYQLFGSRAGLVPADLQKRYRLLMRLTHPDFASSFGGAWPQDAAARINRAYEILSSPQLRQRYDAELVAGARTMPAPVPRPAPHVRAPVMPRRGRHPRMVMAVVCSLLAALGGYLLLPDTDRGQLVQRKALPSACAQQADACMETATPGATLQVARSLHAR